MYSLPKPLKLLLSVHLGLLFVSRFFDPYVRAYFSLSKEGFLAGAFWQPFSSLFVAPPSSFLNFLFYSLFYSAFILQLVPPLLMRLSSQRFWTFFWIIPALGALASVFLTAFFHAPTLLQGPSSILVSLLMLTLLKEPSRFVPISPTRSIRSKTLTACFLIFFLVEDLFHKEWALLASHLMASFLTWTFWYLGERKARWGKKQKLYGWSRPRDYLRHLTFRLMARFIFRKRS